MEQLSVSLYNRDTKLAEAIISPFETVESLSDIARRKTNCPCKLVFAGHILCEQLSLQHYHITNNSKIFVVPTRPKPTPEKEPRELILELFHCTRRLDQCPHEEYCERMAKIEFYLQDERLQKLVETDPWADRVVSQIIDFVETCPREVSFSEARTICQIEDNWIMQVENMKGGLKALQDALEEPEIEVPVIPTVIAERSENVPNEALPVCWRRIEPQFFEFDIKARAARSPATSNTRPTCNL